MSSPLLSDLSQLQRSLDPVDIEGIQSLLHGTASGDAEKESVFANIDPRRPSAEDLIAFIDHWETWQSTARAIDQLLRDTPPDRCLNQYMVAYTLSATFKDCSLIIRYRFQTPDRSDQQNTKGERRLEFESITLIDMDIKPMRNLAKWAQLDRTIWQAYRDHPPSVNRRCVE
jgi:inositol-pentakisphosphate 2-kinase